MKWLRMMGLWALAALVVLSACAGQTDQPGQTDTTPAGKTLYEHGLELIGQMREMAASEPYLQIFTDDEETHALLKQAGQGAEEQPRAVYRLWISEEGFSNLEALGFSLEGLSEGLRERVQDKIASAVCTQINVMGGSTVLAAASMCTAQNLFVSTELEQNEIYLYIYETAIPAAVAFTKGEDHAVLASGMFLLYDGLTVDSLEELQRQLEPFGVSVEKLTQPDAN